MAQHPRLSRALTAQAYSGGLRVAAALLVAGCSADVSTDPDNVTGHTFRAVTGQDLEIRLQSIGPGEYRSPPTISSGAIRFRDVSLATPHVPAGVTQLFRFEALTPGHAIVVFRHSEQSVTVVDTVEVQ